MAQQKSVCDAGDAGDAGLIPGLERSPGGENSNQLQYSCLKNPMDRGAGHKESDKTEVTRHAQTHAGTS